VDRVVVHIEQMCRDNAHAKTFGLELAKLLQALVPDTDKCVVRLSHPNLHHSGGPAFCLGEEIVQALALQPVSTLDSEFVPAARKRAADRQAAPVVPSSYARRKKMSADVFRYVVEADEVKRAQMKLDVADGVRDYHLQRLATDPSARLHDLGDALLHALRGILCGSCAFRSVQPKPLSLYTNRTVCVSFFPERAYWASVLVSWNGCLVEGIGWYTWKGKENNPRFLSQAYARRIERSISVGSERGSRELGVALKAFDGGGLFASVDHIKVVVKQQTKFLERRLETRREAGAFTNATVAAMMQICDRVMGVQTSNRLKRNDKKTGWAYIRTNRNNQRKFQVVRSTGKHTNAVLTCLAWFRDNLASFVEQRRLKLDEYEKGVFFEAIREVSLEGRNNLELIQLSDRVCAFLASDDVAVKLPIHYRNFADLILIALSKNQTHVKSVAANYRNTRGAGDDDAEDQPPARRRRLD
jgi:hypothetical protein